MKSASKKKSIFSLFGIALILIIGLICFSCGTTDTEQGSRPDRGQAMGQQGGRPEMPDLAAAAEKLGISEDVLMEAMGDPQQGPPDFAEIAEKLGITEEELMEALGVPEGGGQPPAGRR